MSDINPEWIEKAAQALHDLRSRRSWAFHEIGQPLGDTVYDDERRADARAALEAVADELRAEGAAKALREAADAWQVSGWAADVPPAGADRPALILGMAQRATNFLRSRADQIEARDE